MIEDANSLVEPWNNEVTERVEQRTSTFLQKRTVPSGDADVDDEAVGAYEVAQIFVVAEDGEEKSGTGAGPGFNPRSAYRRNTDVLADLVDSIDEDELDVAPPASSG